MKRRTARLGMVLGGLAVGLTLAEMSYRRTLARQRHDSAADQAWREQTTALNRTLYRRSEVEGLVYEPAPGASLEMPYGLARFSAQQARGEAHYSEQKGELPRVLLLGDSLVFSERLSEEQSLHQALEGVLDGRAEVLSFGVSGYDIQQVATFYDVAVARFDVDVVVVVYCLNDAMIMSGPYNAHANAAEAQAKKDQDAWLDARARVRAETVGWLGFRQVEDAWLKWPSAVWAWAREQSYGMRPDYTDEYLLVYDSPPHRARVSAALQQLAPAISATGATPVLLISPLLREWQAYRWHDVHAFVAAEAAAAGFSVVDPLPRWQQAHDPDALRLPGDSLHYGALGNTVLAHTIARSVPLPPP